MCYFVALHENFHHFWIHVVNIYSLKGSIMPLGDMNNLTKTTTTECPVIRAAPCHWHCPRSPIVCHAQHQPYEWHSI